VDGNLTYGCIAADLDALGRELRGADKFAQFIRAMGPVMEMGIWHEGIGGKNVCGNGFCV
jgi:hypothetical protein